MNQWPKSNCLPYENIFPIESRKKITFNSSLQACTVHPLVLSTTDSSLIYKTQHISSINLNLEIYLLSQSMPFDTSKRKQCLFLFFINFCSADVHFQLMLVVGTILKTISFTQSTLEPRAIFISWRNVHIFPTNVWYLGARMISWAEKRIKSFPLVCKFIGTDGHNTYFKWLWTGCHADANKKIEVVKEHIFDDCFSLRIPK